MVLPPSSQPGKPKRGRGRPPGKKNVKKSVLNQPILAGTCSCSYASDIIETTSSEANNVSEAVQIETSLVPFQSAPMELEQQNNNSRQEDNQTQGDAYNKCMEIDVQEDFETENERSTSLALQPVWREVDEQHARILGVVNVFTNIWSSLSEPDLKKELTELMESFLHGRINPNTFSQRISTLYSTYPNLLEHLKSSRPPNENLNELERSDPINEERNCDEVTNMHCADELMVRGEAAGCPESLALVQWTPPDIASRKEFDLKLATTNNTVVIQSTDIFEAETLLELATHAINLNLILERRLSKESHEAVRDTLTGLHELRINSVPLSPVTHTDEFIHAYDVICEHLRHEPDLMEVINAFFASEKLYQIPLSIHAETDASSTSTHFVNNVAVSNISGKETEFSKSDHSNTLQELKNANHRHTLTEHEVSSGKNSEIQNCYDLSEDELRRSLQRQLDEDKWITDLVSALGLILMNIPSLRSFIVHNLGIILLRHNNASDDSNNETENCSSLDPNSRSFASCQMDSNEEENGSYNIHLDKSTLPKCSGRTELCNQVLNDEYISKCPRKKFRHNVRTKEEQRMDDYEDARYEVDMLLFRGARTIEVLENVQLTMSMMKPDELISFKLDEFLGGSSIVHKQVIHLFFKCDEEFDIIKKLRESPKVYIPGVLKLLKVRDKEWIELRNQWNLRISSDLKKFKDKCDRESRMQKFNRRVPLRFRNYRKKNDQTCT